MHLTFLPVIDIASVTFVGAPVLMSISALVHLLIFIPEKESPLFLTYLKRGRADTFIWQKAPWKVLKNC